MKKLIVVAGPTASGKSTYALQLAKKIGGFLISADSRQIYKELTILTGKDSGEWKTVNCENIYMVDGVAEYMVDLFEVGDEVSVFRYQQMVYEIIDRVARQDYIPILVGGTGLYISAVMYGYDLNSINSPDSAYRAELESRLALYGLDSLVNELRVFLPDADTKIDTKNPRRVIRALELSSSVANGAGNINLSENKNSTPRFDVTFNLLDQSREDLYRRIDARIDEMLDRGGWEEAEYVLNKYGDSLNAVTGIGYRQLGLALNGNLSRQEAVELFKRDTRRYAKRQQTWFKAGGRYNDINLITV